MVKKFYRHCGWEFEEINEILIKFRNLNIIFIIFIQIKSTNPGHVILYTTHFNIMFYNCKKWIQNF